MTPAYLLTREVAELLDTSIRTVDRMLAAGQLPHLEMLPTIRRVEAAALVPGAPLVLPHGPTLVTKTWLAPTLRLHQNTVQGLAMRGVLPMWKRGARDNGTFTIHRHALWHWVMAHSRGEEIPLGRFPVDAARLARMQAFWNSNLTVPAASAEEEA